MISVSLEAKGVDYDALAAAGSTANEATSDPFDRSGATGPYAIIPKGSGGEFLAVDKAVHDSFKTYAVLETLAGAGGFGVGHVNRLNSVSLMERVVASGADEVTRRLQAAMIEIDQSADSLKDLAYKQLIGESVVNLPSAVLSAVHKSQSAIYGRLDRVRNVERATPPAAGERSALERLWVGGFGVQVDRDADAGVHGYDYKSRGLSLGYDRRVHSIPGLTLGLSGSLADGTMDDDDGLTKTDVRAMGVGIYASFGLPSGVFLDLSGAVSRTKNEYATRLIVGGSKSGDFNVDAWQVGGRLGYVARLDSCQLIPSVGVRYLGLKQKSWTENVSDSAVIPNWFASTNDSLIDVPIQIKLNARVEIGSTIVTPEFRLGYTIVAKEPDSLMNVGFVGNRDTAQIFGVRASKNTFQVGAGLKIGAASAADVFFNYDLDAASGYASHTGSIGVSFVF